MTSIKMVGNILSLNQKLHYDNLHSLKLEIPHLDNRINWEMNNVGAIDHATRDWIDDTDYLLPRMVAEFPRISDDYKSKFGPKPWGEISNPIYTDPFLDEMQLRLSDTYQPGVWYYSGYPMTDHHDFAGLPGNFKYLQTLIGREYRPTFWINIFNRLRSLEFSDDDFSKVERQVSKAVSSLS